MRWFNFLRHTEKRVSSSEMESAINKVLIANTIADATSKPYISEEGSLNLSAVWACVRILSETVGTLPIHLYKRHEKGRERQYSHHCHKLIQSPNSYANRFDLMHHLMVSCALWGNGYARIYRDNLHRPIRLQLLHPLKVEPILDTQTDTLYYRLDNGTPSGGQILGGEIVSNDDIIHLKNLSTNGYKGKSPIAVHREGHRPISQGGQPTTNRAQSSLLELPRCEGGKRA